MAEDINITDGGTTPPAPVEPIDGELMLEARITTAGFGDIWNFIANLMKNNLFSHVTKLVDILYVKPDQYKVTDLMTAMKEAVAALFTAKQAGPPMASAAMSNTAIESCFRLEVGNKAAGKKYTIEEVRAELAKRGKTKVPLSIILGIIQMAIQYGPGIWALIDQWFGSKS